MAAISVEFDPQSLPDEAFKTLQAEAVRRGVPLATLLRDGAELLADQLLAAKAAGSRKPSTRKHLAHV